MKLEREKNSTIRKKIYLLITVRFVIIGCCLIALTIQKNDWDVIISFSLNPSLFLLQILFAINIFYLLITPLVSFSYSFVVLQILLDLIAETILVYLSGGIFSIFTSLYFISILACGILISPNSSIICASIATISISTIAFIYFLSALHSSPLPFLPKDNLYTSLIALDLPFCKAYLFAQGVAFFLVAFLSRLLSITLSQERILQKEILQNLTDGVLVVNAKHKIIFLNDMARQILGIANSAVAINKNVFELLDANAHRALLQIVKMKTAVAQEIEILQHGKILPLFATLSLIRKQKKVRAWITIMRDFSERKRLEQMIQEANRLSMESEIAATIAHEIRNPLASIRGAIQELKDSLSPDDARYLLLDITVRESDRINSIITDFLEFSRIRQPIFCKCNASHLLEEIAILLEKRKEFAQGIIHREIEPNLTIEADAEHIKQVFYNLGINSIEAAEKPQIAIRARRQSRKQFPFANAQSGNVDGVEVQFIDNGQGIPAENLRNIFTAFFTTKHGGTGMGLALVSKIIDLHHGSYHVNSRVGEGTTFYVWLPESPASLR